MSLTLEAIDLLEAIIICMKWQDVQTTRHSKIGSLVKKDVSFLVSTLRKCGRNK